MIINEIELIDNDDMVIHSSINGVFEPETFKYMKDNLEEESVFIDVGAYTGVYSIYANKMKYCQVYSFEPNPVVFERLVENVTKNECHPNDVILMNHGLSNAQMTERFYVSPRTKLTSGGSFVKSDHKKEIYCKLEKFDDLTISVLTIDMIKIDVEGYELQVLEGMKHTLKRDKPKIIVELLTDREIIKVDKFLKKLNYKMIKRCDSRNYIYE